MGLVCNGIGKSRIEIYNSNGYYRIFIYDKDNEIDIIIKEKNFDKLISDLIKLKDNGNRKI